MKDKGEKKNVHKTGHKTGFAISIAMVVLMTLFLSASLVLAQDEAPAGEPAPLEKAAVPPKPTTISPTGNNVTYTNPTFKWNKSTGADNYIIRVYSYNAKSFIATTSVPNSVCGATCSYKFSPSLGLGYGVY